MSAGNELTPQQEFDNVLSKAAVDIARMEQVRDDPGRPGSPAPAPKPPGAPPTSSGGRPPADKSFQDNAIADRKAATLKQVEQISNKVPADQKKDMMDKAYSTLYPADKNDLNQIPRSQFPRDKEGKHMGDKEVDNAQERANALRSKQAAKEQPATQKSDTKDQEKKSGKEQAKSSMSMQFKQPLEGNKVQEKDMQNPSPDKGKSMSTRFTQSLNQHSKAVSQTIRSSPSPSAPGGRESGTTPGGRGE